MSSRELKLSYSVHSDGSGARFVSFEYIKRWGDKLLPGGFWTNYNSACLKLTEETRRDIYLLKDEQEDRGEEP